MKKFLKISAIVLVTLLALMIILPFAFRGKIIEKIKTTINENVNATVDFGGFGISLFRSFPDVSIRLNDLSVVGVNAFEGDTLVSIGRLLIAVNLKSVIGSDGFEIKSIRLDNPRIMLKVLADGSYNWDVAPATDETTPAQDVTAEEESPFKLALKRLQVNNGYFVYDDRAMDFIMRIENLNSTVKGDLSLNVTTLEFRNTTADATYMIFEGIPFLGGVFTDLTADIDFDINNFAFEFRENSLKLNDLILNFEGSFAWPAEDMILDLRFSSPQTSFKSLLSMVPAMFTKDFEELKTSGTLGVNGFVKGIYNDNVIPGFGINIEVANGMFQYPDLPAAITDVFIKTSLSNPGGDPDLTEIDISRFTLKVAGNPVEMKLNLKTPVSDPQIDAFVKGKLDLARVKDFYPLGEGETLAGVIDADITAKGCMSSIENEKYNDFLFNGQLLITGLRYVSEMFTDGVEIATTDLAFAPQFAQLRAFRMKAGDSDMSASGRIDNILGFALNDEMLSGRFETYSSFFNLNQFMQADTTGQAPQEESTPLSVIEVPANINFVLQSRFDKILFGDLQIANATGSIIVADQKVSMSNLRMDLLGGTLVLNGSYSTRDIKKPEIDLGLAITNFDFQKTFNTFNTFAAIAPIGKRASGLFSAGLNLKGLLNENLEPVLPSLAGGGLFNSKAMTVENSPSLTGLASSLKMDQFNRMDIRDVLLNFEFRNGRVDIKPFDFNLGSSKATLSGNHGFDQSINYIMSLAIPRTQFGGTANQVLDNLVGQAAGRGINITPSDVVNVGVAFTGTVTDPKISLTLAQSAADARQQIISTVESAVREVVTDVRQQVQETIDETKQKVSEELERRAAQVIAEAERQAENVRREAANIAETVRREAREQAKKLDDEASGPIAKAAARRSGEQLIKTADDRATRLEREADDRATILVNEARQRADKIRTGEQ